MMNKEGIIKLWQEAFGDSRNYIEHFLENMSDMKILTRELDGETASMLFMIDCELVDIKTYTAKYIYACATKEEYKGRGLMTSLLDEAQKEDCDFLILVPANEKLFDFYSKRGYKALLKQKKIEISREALKALSKGKPSNCESLHTGKIRTKFLTNKPYVKWSDAHLDFIKSTYQGKVLCLEDKGYAFIRIEKNIAYIDEFCIENDSTTEMLKLIYENTEVQKYIFFLPEDCSMISDRFEIINKGMLLPLNEKMIADAYIGLPME